MWTRDLKPRFYVQEVCILDNKPSHIVISCQSCQNCVTKPAQASGQAVLKAVSLNSSFTKVTEQLYW